MGKPELSDDYIKEVVKACRPYSSQGEVAAHIPGFDQSNLTDLGVTVLTTDDELYSAGDVECKFSLQSVSKIILLLIALNDFDKKTIFQRVGMEPTGDFFNSISNLEQYESHKPYNPMINSGAIAVSSMIKGSKVDDKIERILEFLQKITGNNKIKVNKKVYESEKKNGARNRSLAYFMESMGLLSEGELEVALDVYFQANAIDVNCLDLAKIGCFFANHGKPLDSEKQLIEPRHIRTAKAIMMTAGMYNESGSYAVEVGLPAKSGICGSMMAAVPGKMGIGIIGPAINEKGNSVAGGQALMKISRELELNLFGGF